jgi:hypothetical protein
MESMLLEPSSSSFEQTKASAVNLEEVSDNEAEDEPIVLNSETSPTSIDTDTTNDLTDKGWEKIIPFEDYKTMEIVTDTSEKAQLYYYLTLTSAANHYSIARLLLSQYHPLKIMKWLIHKITYDIDEHFHVKGILQMSIDDLLSTSSSAVVSLLSYFKVMEYIRLLVSFAFFMNKGGYSFAHELLLKLKDYLIMQWRNRSSHKSSWHFLFQGISGVDFNCYHEILIKELDKRMDYVVKEDHHQEIIPVVSSKESRMDTLARLMGLDSDDDDRSDNDEEERKEEKKESDRNDEQISEETPLVQESEIREKLFFIGESSDDSGPLGVSSSSTVGMSCVSDGCLFPQDLKDYVLFLVLYRSCELLVCILDFCIFVFIRWFPVHLLYFL